MHLGLKRIVMLACLCFSLTACMKDKKQPKARADLRSLGLSQQMTAMTQHRVAQLVEGQPYHLGPAILRNSNVQVESLKFPIRSISLAERRTGNTYSGQTTTIYECPFTTDKECAVDVASTDVTKNLLPATDALQGKPGQYALSVMDYCVEHPTAGGIVGRYTVWIKAKVALQTVTYYTSATGLTTDESLFDELALEVKNAGCSDHFFLGEKIRLEEKEGSTQQVTALLYVDPNGMLFGAAQEPTTTVARAGEGDHFLVNEGPQVLGGLEAGIPTIERYKLSFDGLANAYITLMFDGNGKPSGGTMVNWFNNTEQDAISVSEIARVEKTDDGLLNIWGWDSTDNETLVIQGFTRSSSQQGQLRPSGFTDEFAYTAEKME